MAFRDGYVSVNGLRLHYLDWDGKGRLPVVLVHGLTSNAHSWDLLAESLKGSHRVLALDMRGHGESEWAKDGKYNIEDLLLDMESFIDALRLESFVLAGHSMGSGLSVRYTARHPSRVERLILVEGNPNAQPSPGWLKGMYLVRDMPDEFDSLEEALAHMRRFYPRASVEVVRHLTEHSVRRLPSGKLTWNWDRFFRERMRRGELPKRLDLWPFLVKLDCPTLVFRGARSTNFPMEIARKVLAHIPKGTLVEIPGAGHPVPLDNPTAFNEAFLSFLNGR
ncbi:MAG: alpha/beta hydrolase [Chloroflexi bacterium]|nr:alpha/beta hydrolase [Chloroflexota bacterium]